MGMIRFVIRNILLSKNGKNRHIGDFCHSTENCGNAADFSSIIQDGINGTIQSSAGGDRTVKNENIFSFDHHMVIIPEQHMAGAVAFRSDNIPVR